MVRKAIALQKIAVWLVFLVVMARPLPALADGGPVTGPALWQFLTEGQQVAVVSLKDSRTADIDLFISLLDSTGVSHNVTFFVPLGYGAGDFGVYEQELFTFDRVNTQGLDRFIFNDMQRRRGAVNALFGVTLLTNGVFLLPLWLPALLTGCGEAGTPLASFETSSSQVSIYGLDADTNLDDLIATTGLDPSVQETLRRLQGQQIAVVDLQTRALTTGGGPDTGAPERETGIHLKWSTSLAESGGTYHYPLGTGSAWYHPIEVTRVYVVAPPGLDFDIGYPRLGEDLSGYQGRRQRITGNTQVPAYAIDEARGDFGRVWRAIYTQSNATEDITIMARPQSAFSKVLVGFRSAGTVGVSVIWGIIVALACWLLSWRFLMPRLLRGTYRGDAGYLWGTALVYIGINALVMIPGVVLYFFWSFTGNAVTLALAFLLFGGVAAAVFFLGHLRRLSDNTSLAARAFFLVTLASNGAYLIIAMAYAALTGVI